MKVFVASIIADGFNAIHKGFVASVLWGWFFVDKFGLPVLSVSQAFGVAITVGFVSMSFRKPSEDVDMGYVVEGVLISLIRSGFCLLYGWIAFQFV